MIYKVNFYINQYICNENRRIFNVFLKQINAANSLWGWLCNNRCVLRTLIIYCVSICFISMHVAKTHLNCIVMNLSICIAIFFILLNFNTSVWR